VTVVGGDGTQSDDSSAAVKSLPPLKFTAFYFVLDEESLGVYAHWAAPSATHDFRFYREPGDRSVETIYSCHDEHQLELQRGDNVFYLHPADSQQVLPARFRFQWGTKLFRKL